MLSNFFLANLSKFNLLEQYSLTCLHNARSINTFKSPSLRPGKHRGWKKMEGDYVEKGMILFRQLGLQCYPGENVSYSAYYCKHTCRLGIVFNKFIT